MKRSSMGLRTRLMLLVLAAVVPAFVAIGYTAIEQRRQVAQNVTLHAQHLIQLAVREQSQLIANTRQLLFSLSRLPAVRRPHAVAACNRTLADLLEPYPYYTNLGVATPEGRVICSALPMARPVDIADRSYFRRSVQSRDFGVGDYQVGRITGIPAINFGYPVIDDRGEIQAVVYAALNLSWVGRLISTADFPPGSTLTVVDSRGTLLAHYPDSKPLAGQSMRKSQLVAAILERREAGTVELEDPDGVARLYVFAPLYDSLSGSVYVSAGIPKSIAFAASDRVFARNIAFLLFVAALTLIAAWVGSDAFVLQRVQALAKAARLLGKGDLSARTGLTHEGEELGRLARTFDEMAASLQRVNRALKTLSAGNRAVVRATDEQALLQEMCRIIVDVGGYPLAWVGYTEEDENTILRPVAQAGFEGGLEALMEIVQATCSDTAWDRRPAAKAIESGGPSLVRRIFTDADSTPWRDEARRRGYASAAAFPLCFRDRVIGALSIYSHEPDAFDADELKLLTEAAEDLAYGIATLRTRVDHAAAHETIRRMAYYDGLTGLPNHIQLEERLHRAITEARNRPLALLMLDLERFREINDAMGFQQGDRLLRDVAARLRAALSENEMVARMRGDEFAVLLPTCDAGGATEIALRILAALEEAFVLDGLTLAVNAVVGIALFPRHGDDAARLVRHADVAMHQAKKTGRSYFIYAAHEDRDDPRRLALAGELRRAIENNELLLHYQPKIDLGSGRTCGAEALVRWLHPSQGMIPPNNFIGLAEHTGLIKPLTDWVLNAALRQSSAWRNQGLNLPIAVNLSARNLRDPELLDKMERAFVAAGVDSGQLELEITESAIMDDPEGALEILERLSGLGIRLFIDDFGTGYSSLAYLKKLPVDAVKIDKSFVIDMLTDADSAAIVRSTILLSHDLELKVVAEGVENQAMREHLAALGCDAIQGYHISKPLPLEQFESWWSQHLRSFNGPDVPNSKRPRAI